MFNSVSTFESNLFDDFRRMERTMDQLFDVGPWRNGIRSVARGTYPPMNIGSTSDQIDIYLFAAGVDPDSLDISIQQNLLTVDGKHKSNSDSDANYFRKERFDGEFHRVVTLPDDADSEKVNASYRDGIVHITVQRRESAKPRQIEVN